VRGPCHCAPRLPAPLPVCARCPSVASLTTRHPLPSAPPRQSLDTGAGFGKGFVPIGKGAVGGPSTATATASSVSGGGFGLGGGAATARASASSAGGGFGGFGGFGGGASTSSANADSASGGLGW
jgi:hypothetical protein